VVTPLLDTRAIGDVILSVARGLPAAAKALPWSDEVAFLKETIAALPAGQAGGSDADVQWARFLQHGGWRPAQAASAPSGAPSLRPMQVATTHYQGEAQEYPFFLHLYLSELLSDGRGASQPWLQGSPEANTSIAWQTWVEINPATAQQMGVAQGDIVEVTSPYGSLEAPVYLYPGIRPDTVAIPFGQGHTDYGRYARDRGSTPIHLAPGAPGASGDLVWSTLRVRVTRTGRRQHVATFEYSLGVTEGFLNKAFPGQ
jgi:anaerobic selenocysteine-containing dehydrogenase